MSKAGKWQRLLLKEEIQTDEDVKDTTDILNLSVFSGKRRKP